MVFASILSPQSESSLSIVHKVSPPYTENLNAEPFPQRNLFRQQSSSWLLPSPNSPDRTSERPGSESQATNRTDHPAEQPSIQTLQQDCPGRRLSHRRPCRSDDLKQNNSQRKRRKHPKAKPEPLSISQLQMFTWSHLLDGKEIVATLSVSKSLNKPNSLFRNSDDAIVPHDSGT